MAIQGIKPKFVSENELVYLKRTYLREKETDLEEFNSIFLESDLNNVQAEILHVCGAGCGACHD